MCSESLASEESLETWGQSSKLLGLPTLLHPQILDLEKCFQLGDRALEEGHQWGVHREGVDMLATPLGIPHPWH